MPVILNLITYTHTLNLYYITYNLFFILDMFPSFFYISLFLTPLKHAHSDDTVYS